MTKLTEIFTKRNFTFPHFRQVYLTHLALLCRFPPKDYQAININFILLGQHKKNSLICLSAHHFCSVMKMIMIEFQERQKWKPGFCVVEIVCVMINLTKDNINVRPSKKKRTRLTRRMLMVLLLSHVGEIGYTLVNTISKSVGFYFPLLN